MMVHSYYGIYQAGVALTGPEDRAPEAMASVHWREGFGGGQDDTGLGLDLPCTEDPELFFAESPQDIEQAKALCRGCRARLACLAGAVERREPWGVWGGELLMGGAIVPRKRPRGRPRKERHGDRVALAPQTAGCLRSGRRRRGPGRLGRSET
jgi:WhiB family redox-sensing transcriptional regulator